MSKITEEEMQAQVKEIPAWVAERILLARDASYRNDENEVYHQLYSIANPMFNKHIDDVWKDLEAAAATTPANETPEGNLLPTDSEMIDWLQRIMTDDNNYCEVFFAGLRNQTGKVTAFQIESNPQVFQTLNAPTVREAIAMAMQYENALKD